MGLSCGTYGGFQAHARGGEPPCDDCRDARNEYMRRYRAKGRGKVTTQSQQRAYWAAQRRLRAAHRDEFDRYYTEEAAKAAAPPVLVMPKMPRDAQQARARSWVNKQVASGHLLRASKVPCADCGHLGTTRRHEYHHYVDYSREHYGSVVVLCQACHSDRHPGAAGV